MYEMYGHYSYHFFTISESVLNFYFGIAKFAASLRLRLFKSYSRTVIVGQSGPPVIGTCKSLVMIRDVSQKLVYSRGLNWIGFKLEE